MWICFLYFICLQPSKTARFANVYVENFESPLQICLLSRSEMSTRAKALPTPCCGGLACNKVGGYAFQTEGFQDLFPNNCQRSVVKYLFEIQ